MPLGVIDAIISLLKYRLTQEEVDHISCVGQWTGLSLYLRGEESVNVFRIGSSWPPPPSKENYSAFAVCMCPQAFFVFVLYCAGPNCTIPRALRAPRRAVSSSNRPESSILDYGLGTLGPIAVLASHRDSYIGQRCRLTRLSHVSSSLWGEETSPYADCEIIRQLW